MKVSLETERLLLRPFHLDDLAAYAAINRDPEVMRYIGDGRPMSDTESFQILSMLVGHWELRGYGVWALEHKGSGALIGHAGLWYPSNWPGVELCYRLARDYWGKGLATEVARRVQSDAFDRLAIPSLVSLIHPRNTASIRVATKTGMTLTSGRQPNGSRVDVYGCNRAVV